MNNKFSKIGLIGKYGDASVNATLLRLAAYLQRRGCQVWYETTTAKEISGDVPTAEFSEIGQTCDLAITVGGDGTLLHTARSLVNYEIPLLGINLGRLGFLVDVHPDEMEARLDKIMVGDYLVESRIMLSAMIDNENEAEPRVSDAFNDVVVHKWEVARMIETETYIDGKLLNIMRSDGLIISTPTGSTAYALSGGGPILEPHMEAMVIVPICPHSMSYRPIVLDGSSKIDVIVRDYPHSHAQVTCDGQINLGLVSGDRIHITRKDKKVHLIHPTEHDQYHVLREKLHWGERF